MLKKDDPSAGIKAAKARGHLVCTNTTIYKETDMKEIEDMYEFLGELGLDGHTISPGYEYDAAKKDMIERLNLQPENFFLTREMTRQKFKDIEDWTNRFPVLGTPVYFEFLAGKRDLTCSAWAIPTRNIRGWKGPCYLMTDGHYTSYRELLEKTNWDAIGVVDGVARDPRCENCMVHCGYDPSGALGTNYQSGDNWKNFRYNFGAKPKPYLAGASVKAFNGVSIGKGHLAEAKAAVQANDGGNGHAHPSTFCGSGDTSERDDLLAKVREARKAKEVALEKAQEELHKALSPRQEAGAVLAGLLK
jgi:hypothetical protein